MSTQPTDEELLALNAGEVYFSESPSKYPEVHGTQYHAGAPGVLAFARAVIAKWGTPATGGEPVASQIAAPSPGMNTPGSEEQKQGLQSALAEVFGWEAATSPQPVRGPMPRRTLLDMTQCYSDRETFGRAVEAWHGITGGQHG